MEVCKVTIIPQLFSQDSGTVYERHIGVLTFIPLGAREIFMEIPLTRSSYLQLGLLRNMRPCMSQLDHQFPIANEMMRGHPPTTKFLDGTLVSRGTILEKGNDQVGVEAGTGGGSMFLRRCLDIRLDIDIFGEGDCESKSDVDMSFLPL